ncbi:MAG TPA: hypothetical protein VGB82_03900 [Alphaproteobacteria bacterium]
MKSGRLYLALAVMLAMMGCEAVGVGASSDPEVKIGQARELEREGRLWVAKRLLDEALEIYQKRNDEEGIAEAYRQFALFYRTSPKGRGLLVPDEFVNTPEGAQKRYLLAIDYFQKSLAIVQKLGRIDREVNLYFVMSETQAWLNDTTAACMSLQNSLDASHKALQLNPQLQFEMGRFKSWDELIDSTKRVLKCA